MYHRIGYSQGDNLIDIDIDAITHASCATQRAEMPFSFFFHSNYGISNGAVYRHRQRPNHDVLIHIVFASVFSRRVIFNLSKSKFFVDLLSGWLYTATLYLLSKGPICPVDSQFNYAQAFN